MTTFDMIATQIIKEQELVIGPLAWGEAGKVRGLVTNSGKEEVLISDADPKAVIDRLVGQYERLFGRASHEVCKEAAAPLLVTLTLEDIPLSLRASS